ncbi:MAG TPA: nucleotidyltransferase family protein [Tepidisphaeraceae bacterium]|jgi:NDP-sugar pyrophosphorylase family protein|nr:nucleotidyltransferase family protein [Tepidisphaeraceae bacterium]
MTRISIADVPAAILCGGLATRLGPITQTIPKAMLEIAGRPFIDHQLDLLRRNGFSRVVLCLGHLGEQIVAHLGDGGGFGLRIDYSHDGENLIGTGGALRRAADQLGEMFWVLYGDSYMDIDYAEVLADFVGWPADLAMMTVLRNDDRWDRSNAIFEAGRVMRYDKRRRSPAMRFIDYGVGLLRREALLRIEPDRSSDLAGLYSALAAEGRLAGHEVFTRFYEIGTPQSLEETRAYLVAKSA